LTELHPATEEVDNQSILLMSLSATAEHVLHTALVLRSTETTVSAPQLEAHLQATPEEQFPENHDIVQQSVCQVADRGHFNVSDNPSSEAGV
jgi:hypothetical protein